MAIVCPECEERIPNNSKECPECGAFIDVSLRYNPVRVGIMVVALSVILFVALPSIVKTLFFSEPPVGGKGKVIPLEKIQETLGDDKILKLQKSTLNRIGEDSSGAKMQWRLVVENQSSAPVLFDSDIRFLDENGGEVHTEYIVESGLPGEATRALSGTFSLPPDLAESIKNMRTIVQPADLVVEE